MSKLAELKKLIAAMAGLAAVGLSAGLVPSSERVLVTTILAVLSALGVYGVRNATPTKSPPTSNGAPQYKA